MERKELENILTRMTLEEKIGQLVQLTPDFFSKGTGEITGPMADLGLSEEELYTIGSVLGTHTKEEVIRIQKNYLKKSRLKIPLVFMADVIHGYETIFPIPLALGASFSEELVKKVADYSAKETTEAGVHVTFSPMVDLVRDPRWGRVLESTGEDSYLNTILGSAFVKGYQGENGNLSQNKDKIAACLKHFAAYGAAEGGRDYNTVDMSDLNLYENYLPSFAGGIAAGAKLVMTSFNVFKGIPSTANQWLLKKVLREDLDFKGLVISDWGAVRELVTHGVAEDLKEAAILGLNAGCDMDMMSNAYLKNLKEALKENAVTKEQINAAVLKVLELKNDLGLFEDPYRGVLEKENTITASEKIRQVAREAVRKSCVLLKNEENILPLQPQQKIALVGPFAESNDLLGAWSWIGKKEEVVTLKEGLEKVCPSLRTVGTKERACFTKDELENMLEAAKNNDVVIVALGESSAESGEATSKGQPILPSSQVELLRELQAVNPNIVTILFNGRPLILEDVAQLSKGLLEAFFPGSEGGNGISDLLVGKYSPEGKLPMTYPLTIGQIPLHYDELTTGRPLTENYQGGGYVSFYLDQPNTPLYPFGYGLTYGNLTIKEVKIPKIMKENLDVTLTLENHSFKEVSETLQVYVKDHVGKVALPKRKLRKILKVTLEGNSAKEVVFSLTKEDLVYVHPDLKKYSDPGEFTLYLGFNSTCPSYGSFTLE